jgi:CRP-like cAMP-binding protein
LNKNIHIKYLLIKNRGEEMLLTRYFFLKEFNKFETFFKEYPHKICNFNKNQYLCKPNQSLTNVYYIQHGLTKVSVIHENGEEKITGFWGKGGIYPLICTEQDFLLEHSILQKSLSEVTALSFSIDIIRQMMTDNPELCFEMVDHYCRFTNLLLFSSTTQTYESVQTRICNILYLFLKNTNIPEKTISLTQQDIASLIGATRIAVVKNLKTLRDKKIIETSRNRIIILDIKKLESYCSEFVK